MNKKLTIKAVSTLKPGDKIFDVMDTEIPGFALRVRPSGTMTYLLFYRNKDGAKRTYTIGKGITAVQARDIAQRVRGEVAQGIDVNERDKQHRLSKQRDKENKLSSFLNTIYAPWLLQHRRNGKADIKSLETNFSSFMSKNLTDITKWDIQRWRMDKKKGGLSDHSIERYLAELRALLNKAVEWERVAYNPIAGLSKPRAEDNKRVRYLSDAERKRLIWALNDREQEIIAGRESGNQWRKERGYDLLEDLSKKAFADYLKPMVLLAINTGMRRGELFQVTWKSVDLVNARITVTAKTAKSKRTRHIPLNMEALNTLKNWKKQQGDGFDYVFPGKGRNPMTDIKKPWATLLDRAGITDFRFHDIRHDFASQLVMKGADLYAIKELLGHSTIQMTERYAHLAPKHLEDAVNLLDG